MSLGLSVATNLLAATSQRRYAIKRRALCAVRNLGPLRCPCRDSRPEPALSEVEGAVQPGKARQFAETRPSSDRCLFDSKSSNHCHAERRWEDRRSSHRSRSIPTPSAHSILSSPAPVDSCLEQMPFPWPGVAAIALLGGAAVHRCDKFPCSLAASAAEVHLLQYSRTSYVYIAGDARWPPR